MMVKTRFSPPVIVFLFLTSLSGIHTVTSQEDYQEGYVITLKNDTLHGTVSDRKLGPFGGIHEKVKLKGKGLKKRFAPKKIRAYHKGGTTYRTMFLDGEYEFMRVETEGQVSHYVYELQEQGEEMIIDVDYFAKGNSSDLVRVTQGIFGIKRKRMIAFFSDCPPLVEKIKNKEFKYAFELVAFYNEWKKNPKTS